MRLAAIVPTYNERARVEPLVRRLRAETDGVWVVDAASPDGTAEAARRAGAEVVPARRKGRGAQLREGARVCGTDAMVFVHADTGVPEGFGRAIRGALADPAVVGGNFRLRFAPDGAAARVFSAAYDLRRRCLGAYYGDSCIFVRREVYDRLGGVPDAPLFEDYAFARALERCGPTAYVTEPAVTTSSRRFARRPLRTLALYAALQVAFDLGVPTDVLARFYADVR